MQKISKLTYDKIYLEITSENFSKQNSNSINEDRRIEKIDFPTYEEYRKWHDLIGKPFGWHERPRINDRVGIESLLGNPKVEMFIFKDGKSEIGYALIEQDNPGQVEVSDFGFPPDKTGQGFGSIFFPMLLENIFATGINRIWLSTRSTNDPRVVSFYEKFGLRVYKREKNEDSK